jgi:hypothetical protein
MSKPRLGIIGQPAYRAPNWSAQKEQAVCLLAEGKLKPNEIAAKVGVSTITLHKWCQGPLFQQRIEDYVRRAERLIMRRGITALAKRIESYLEDWDRLEQLVAGRAKQHADIPGGGLFAMEIKTVGNGLNEREVEVYRYDTALIKDRMALRKQIGIEMGQWSEKREVTGVDGGPIEVEARLAALSMEDLLKLQEIYAKASAEKPAVEVVA